MKKWVLAMFLVIATVLIVSACGKAEESKGETNANASASGEVKEFTIDAKNFEFDLKEMKVKKGDTVKLTLKNSQGNHAVKVEGYEKEVQGNKTISFVADKTGEFAYVCSIFCGAGHEKMTGKLIVE